MKSLIKGTILHNFVIAAAVGILAVPAVAGSRSEKAPVQVEVKEAPFVTGNITVNYETHFISYGQDVWGVGNSWSKSFIHPSAELDFNLGNGLQFYVNTWWDVNDYGFTTIGDHIQEVDLNVGFYYTVGKWKFQLGYGAWMYAEQTESIIDGKISYADGFWNPFLMLHGRPDIGSHIGLSEGLVTQVGIAPAKTWDKLSVSLPITVSFDTNNFHGGDAGFAYVSAGPVLSYAIAKHMVLNFAATYYHTNDSVIPGNPSSDFVVGTAGFTIPF